MTTAEYINWVINQTGKQSTVEEMRVLVNSAQNIIFSKNTYFNKVKPEAACVLPTQAGVLQYSTTDATSFNNPLIRSVPRVYAFDSWGKKVDVQVEGDNAANPGDPAIIYFREDPGETTDTYYYEAYTWPMNGQITNTSIPLSVPDDVKTTLLFYLVNKMQEVSKDGRSIFNIEEEKRYWKDYYTFANQGPDFEPEYTNIGGV
jgi:hypothetical protein